MLLDNIGVVQRGSQVTCRHFVTGLYHQLTGEVQAQIMAADLSDERLDFRQALFPTSPPHCSSLRGAARTSRCGCVGPLPGDAITFSRGRGRHDGVQRCSVLCAPCTAAQGGAA
ncbi:hypothetical protein KFE25_013642 [Diacronema lutheri]|uniref:Uncharacterized protein n=1 Tax=Diacronema lutheri TaxID=2081491 RepID=A0A8J5X9F0_DIALT|nr:hypothetical protein KFE25_004289 [Diacronema lutheri]KAG8468559.1 hypothetical protein KFE25_013642 [Diacronema lutheri]